MENWMELGVFAGKSLLVLITITLLLIVVVNLILKARMLKENLEIEDLGKKMRGFSDHLRFYIGNPKSLKKELKKRKKKEKKSVENADTGILYVLDFEGDIKASQVDALREKVTAVLTVARPGKDEVLVRVSSPGGMVHTYGLAAAQLLRIRENKLRLTVSVDKVAASGGYLMACTAHKIIASPFAIIGSIGVIAQVPNFHRFLKKHDVDYEEITAGEFKRTVSVMGEITEKGREKFKEQIEQTHDMFKHFVSEFRPQLDVPSVATGEYWYGKKALELNLIDELISSDEYIFQRRESTKILKIDFHGKRKLSEKIAESMALTAEKTILRFWNYLMPQ